MIRYPATLAEHREFSKAMDRDPSRTGRLIERYAGHLGRLVSDAVREIRKMLESGEYVELIPEEPEREAGNGRNASNGRELKISRYKVGRWDAERFSADASLVIKAKFGEPAKEAAKDMTEKQVKRAARRTDEILKSIGIEAMVGTMPVDPQVIQAVEESHISSLLGVSDDILARVTEAVKEGIERGEGVRKIAKRIQEAGEKSKSMAKTIARTETMNAYNAATKERYARHGITKVRWKTGGSNICRDTIGFDGKHYPGGCMALDGQVYDLGSEPPQPLHPNCKCVLLAVKPEKAGEWKRW